MKNSLFSLSSPTIVSASVMLVTDGPPFFEQFSWSHFWLYHSYSLLTSSSDWLLGLERRCPSRQQAKLFVLRLRSRKVNPFATFCNRQADQSFVNCDICHFGNSAKKPSSVVISWLPESLYALPDCVDRALRLQVASNRTWFGWIHSTSFPPLRSFFNKIKHSYLFFTLLKTRRVYFGTVVTVILPVNLWLSCAIWCCCFLLLNLKNRNSLRHLWWIWKCSLLCRESGKFCLGLLCFLSVWNVSVILVHTTMSIFGVWIIIR